MGLKQYRVKRDFAKTPEPAPRPGKRHKLPMFVVQEHHARRLHYDFRLEADGVLKSWAVPKGPSLDPADKRLAVHVEDHPLDYAGFEGTIPEGEYGAGEVYVWDRGTYETPGGPEAVSKAIAKGRLEVTLHGKKLQGAFILVRTGGDQADKHWLLIKRHDAFARTDGRATQIGETKPKKTADGSVARAAKAARKVELTHPDKVLFPQKGITKRDVFEFYQRIAPRLLPHLRDRPATLERAPEGLGNGARPHFWQKQAAAHFPAWIQRAELPTRDGRIVQYVVVNDVDTLLYLVNQGTITFHVWPSRVENLAVPDYVLFDLDPGHATFADAVAIAKKLHEILNGEGIKTFVKTSGKAGLHVLTPWRGKGGYDEARAWAQGIAARVVKALPEQATVERSKAKRGRRVYVDVMQNALGQHAVPAYVLRAVPAASVSTPLDWKEVTPALDPTELNLRTIFRRLLRHKHDPLAPLTTRSKS